MVITEIVAQVKEIVKGAESNMLKPGVTLQATLANMVSYLGAVASKLNDKLMNGNGDVQHIVTKIDEKLQGEGVTERDPHRTNKQFLDDAVYTILHQLVGRAQGAAQYIQKLIEKCELAKANTALDNATDLETRLNKLLGFDATGGRREKFAAAVDKAIDGVTSKMEDEIGTSGSDRITKLPDSKFTSYRSCVAQPINGDLTGTPGEGTLPAAIGAIKTKVTTNLTNHNNNDVGTIIGTEDTFTSPFSQITTKLNEIAGLVDSEKQTPKSSDSKTGITNYLDDMLKMLGKDSVDLQSDIKRDHTDVKGLVTIKSEIDAALDEIGKKAKAEFDAASGAIPSVDTFKSLSTEITSNLDKLKTAMSEAGTKVKTQLEELKGKIGRKEHGDKSAATRGTLQKIHDDIVDVLRTQLEPIITSVTELQRFAKNEKFKSISNMCDFVDKEVQDATNKLITQANENYVTSVKEMLQDFASKVQKELKHLTGGIDTDTQHGFKGFMRTLQGIIQDNGETTDENINLLKTIAATISSSSKGDPNHFTDLAKQFQSFWSPLHAYLTAEIQRVHEEKKERINPKPTGVEKLYTSKLDATHTAINKILVHIYKSNRYNHEVPAMLDILLREINGLHQESFSEPNTPLLDGVGKGLDEFAGELGKAYINRYEGSKNIVWDENASNDRVNCAKIMLTIIDLLERELGRLHGDCSVNARSPKTIISTNDLGNWSQNCCFRV